MSKYLIAAILLASTLHTVAAESPESDSLAVCMRATQLFEKQEIAKGTKTVEPGDLAKSCTTETKPKAYWECMEKEASQEIDINVAHLRCAKAVLPNQ